MANESISRTTFVKGLTAGVVVAASLGILNAGEYSINGLPTIGEGNGSYTPGTYTASAPGISSDITVSCTFNETTITAIEADVSGETPGIGADIGDALIGKVLENQIADIDAESGATITSDAFKAAVANCIAQASGETIEAPAEETEAVEPEVAETEAAENESAPDEKTAEPVSAAPVSYVPGTYTGSAAGISSDITVTATFDENGITEITTDVSGETAGIGAEIGDTLITKAMEAQSTEIDAESGATITSDAFKAALADCIAQAVGGEAEAAETEAVVADETEAAETEVAETEVAETEAAEVETSASSTEGTYTPGTYVGTAAGISSDVVLTVTFDESSITHIDADVSGETAGIGAEIGDKMTEEALKAQSADLGWITGATITSDAFKAALADTIAQAKGEKEAVYAPETESKADETEIETEAVETEAVETEADETEAPKTVGKVIYTPGTYTGKAAGISSDVVVTATFDETSITHIDADVSGETAGIGAEIGDKMSAEALKSQSADLGWITGATITSDAFKAALADCIAQASGVETEVTETVETEMESETYFYEGVMDESIQAADAPFVPGTYAAVGTGISSEIKVTVTFDEAKIVSVEADVSGETAGIGADIEKDMVEQILSAQSADVDGISGATITSDAIKEAVADCIAQAKVPEETESETE